MIGRGMGGNRGKWMQIQNGINYYILGPIISLPNKFKKKAFNTNASVKYTCLAHFMCAFIYIFFSLTQLTHSHYATLSLSTHQLSMRGRLFHVLGYARHIGHAVLKVGVEVGDVDDRARLRLNDRLLVRQRQVIQHVHIAQGVADGHPLTRHLAAVRWRE